MLRIRIELSPGRGGLGMPHKESRPNVCVVGCGYWGKNLIRNFHDLGHLRGVFDADPLRAKPFLDRYPGIKSYANWHDVLEDSQLDAVAIVTPAETHAKLGVAALRAGKDVFVEKPLALTPQEGQMMVDTARQLNRILAVGHLLFYHPAV